MPNNPGWYDDPWSRFASRWFDGERWTDSVMDAQGASNIDPPGAVAATTATAATMVNPATGVAAGVPIASTVRPGVRPGPVTVTRWQRFRSLPPAGQVAVWCTIGFVLLLIAAGIVTLASRDHQTSTLEPLPGLFTTTTLAPVTTLAPTTTVPETVAPTVVETTTTAVVEETTTTVIDTTTTVEETTVPPTDPTTTIAQTTLPPTTAAPTTAVPTTAAPTTQPATIPPTVPPTTPPTTSTTTTTTVPATTTTTTTTVPKDPDLSKCTSAPDAGQTFYLTDASIEWSDDHSHYTFIANAIGPSAVHDVEFRFLLNDGDYVVRGSRSKTGMTQGFVEHNPTVTPIADLGGVVPGRVTLTVPNDAIGEIAGTQFDWTIALFIDKPATAGVDQAEDTCTVENFANATA
jgi:hypothetical protein